MSIFLTAVIQGKPGTADQLRPLLETLTAGSRSEAACIQYDLHESVSHPDLFIFHEEWVDQAGLDLHNTQPHIQVFQQAAKDLLAGPATLYKTQRLL